MHSPAPNIPGAASAMSPFTEYLNKLKLEATSNNDIRDGDKTLDAIFAEDALMVVAQHRQVARQCHHKEEVILLWLEQWQPSLAQVGAAQSYLSTMPL